MPYRSSGWDTLAGRPPTGLVRYILSESMPDGRIDREADSPMEAETAQHALLIAANHIELLLEHEKHDAFRVGLRALRDVIEKTDASAVENGLTYNYRTSTHPKGHCLRIDPAGNLGMVSALKRLYPTDADWLGPDPKFALIVGVVNMAGYDPHEVADEFHGALRRSAVDIELVDCGWVTDLGTVSDGLNLPEYGQLTLIGLFDVFEERMQKGGE